MNWEGVLETIWAAVNSPIGVAAAGALLAWLLCRLYAGKPTWRRFEGSIIAAVKLAEKEIPDTIENKAWRRLDLALQYVLKVYERASGKGATTKVTQDLTEGIQIVHAQLESSGALGKAAGAGIPIRGDGDSPDLPTGQAGRATSP